MDRQTTTDLNRRLLANLQQRTTDRAGGETRIPAADFLCADVFAAERRRLFLDTPQPVAFSGELPGPHSFLALEVLDTPVLLTRDSTGQLHAFVNACAHRGHRVASGSGTARSLVCPFHGWAYTPSGTLRGRPEDNAFVTPAEDCGLIPLPVAEPGGLIVVAVDQSLTAAAPEHSLGNIAGELAGFGFERYRPIERRHYEVAANWKLVNDLSLESYHFATLHRESVAQMLAPNAVVDLFDRHSRWAFPLKSIGDRARSDDRDWSQRRLEGSCTYTIYPGVMFIVNALGAQMIRAEPGASPGQSRVTYAGVCRPDCELEDARTAYDFGGDVFAREDLPAAESCQQGIAAAGRDVLLGANEPLLQFWHRQWRSVLD